MRKQVRTSSAEWVLRAFAHWHVKSWASQVIQWYRIRLPMQETQVWSLGREDPLEKEMETHSSILAQKVLWTEKPGGL